MVASPAGWFLIAAKMNPIPFYPRHGSAGQGRVTPLSFRCVRFDEQQFRFRKFVLHSQVMHQVFERLQQ